MEDAIAFAKLNSLRKVNGYSFKHSRGFPRPGRIRTHGRLLAVGGLLAAKKRLFAIAGLSRLAILQKSYRMFLHLFCHEYPASFLRSPIFLLLQSSPYFTKSLGFLISSIT